MFKRVSEQEQIRDVRQSNLLKQVRQNEDTNEVAEVSAIVLEDSMSTAEVVGYLLLEIEELKDRLAKLEGGKQ